MITGIYTITNTKNNRFYLGSSQNIQKRWGSHKYNLLRNQHHSRYLQSAWNKYGEDSFSFDVIKTCKVDELLQFEQIFLDFSCPHYNILKVAGSPRGNVMTEETRKKMSEAKKGKPQKYRLETMQKNREIHFQMLEEAKSSLPELVEYSRSLPSGGYSKSYIALSPDGETYHFTNMTSFCRTHNLNPSAAINCAKGNRLSQKGWRFATA
jgi:group I intron endonuclease